MNSKTLGGAMVLASLVLALGLIAGGPLLRTGGTNVDVGLFSATSDTTQVYTPVFTDVECEVGPTVSNTPVDVNSGHIINDSYIMYQKEINLDANKNSPEMDLVWKDQTSVDGFGEGGEYAVLVDVKGPDADSYERKAVDSSTYGENFNEKTLVSNIEKGSDVRIWVDLGKTLGTAHHEGHDIYFGFEYERYDLKTDSPNMPQTISEGTCDVSKVGEEWLNSDLEEAQNSGKLSGTELGFGKTFSVVSGSTPVVEPMNAIDRDSDGQLDSYITRVLPTGGMYYPIVESNTGNLYADSSSEEGPLSNIECLPASPYCASDGTEELEDPSEKEGTSEFSGGVVGYVPTGDGETVCEYESKDGGLQETNCKDIPECGEDEFLDQNYECSDTVEILDDDQGDEIPIWLIVLAAFIGTLMFGGLFLLLLAAIYSQSG